MGIGWPRGPCHDPGADQRIGRRDDPGARGDPAADGEGALLPQGNRRVAVPELSPEMLEQVAFARLAIEPKLAELAAPKLTVARIDRLEAIDGAVNRAIEAGKLRTTWRQPCLPLCFV